MKRAIFIILFIFIAEGIVISDEIDDAIKDFNKAYKNAPNNSKKIELLISLGQRKDEKVLKVIISLLNNEKEEEIKDTACKIVGSYTTSDLACEAIAKFLTKASQDKNVSSTLMIKVIETLSMMDKNVARKQIDIINKLVRSENIDLVTASIVACGRIRHKSSIDYLLVLLKKYQEEMCIFVRSDPNLRDKCDSM